VRILTDSYYVNELCWSKFALQTPFFRAKYNDIIQKMITPENNRPFFIHLRMSSSYSLAQSAISIQSAIHYAKDHNIPALAITDAQNLFGAFEFSLKCLEHGVQPILGATIEIFMSETEENAQLLLLAQSEEGFKNISSLVSQYHLTNTPCSWEDLRAKNTGVICLSGGIHGPIGRHILANDTDQALRVAKKTKNIFQDRFYLEIMRHHREEEVKTEEIFLKIAIDEHIPIVATNECFYTQKNMFDAHNVLLCLNAGAYIHSADRPHSNPYFYLRTPQEMAELFLDLPEALANTVHIAQRCHFYLTPMKPELPHFPKVGDETENAMIMRVAKQGLATHIKNHRVCEHIAQNIYEERIDYELEVITKMDFSGYFLIMSDIILWAKNQGIPVGPGRGSAAGSLVAWTMGITNVDSLAFDLPFERFLNPDRISMPDFDVDFCQERREEVIHYVRDLYGEDCVAQIITFGTLQARGVLRDVGRVYQLPYMQVDNLCKRIPNQPGQHVSLAEALKDDPILQDEFDNKPEIKKVFEIAMQLEGLHRHASTHAAGVIISSRPIADIIPIYKDANTDLQVTQYTMKYVEFASLIKFDFLGLKTLSVLAKTTELLSNDGYDFNLDSLDFNDEQTFSLLGTGITGGVFQMEGSGMQELLRQAKPDCFDDIIAIVALYRPGPMENIPSFLARKQGKEKVVYLHPLLEDILKESYGIPIYQEQVMRIAQKLAGYSMGEADLLRRAMGKKIPKEMAAQKKRFLDGSSRNNVSLEIAETLFEQIARFAGYAFNKCHATCYAFIAYQTAYMKSHHLPYFMAASLSFDINNAAKIWEHSKSLSVLGSDLLPPDINASDVWFSVQKSGDKKCVRFALSAIKNVGSHMAETIVEERKKKRFSYPSECFQRLLMAGVSKRTIEQLMKAGALDSIERNRALLEYIFSDTKEWMPDGKKIADDQPSFFAEDSVSIVEDNRPSLIHKGIVDKGLPQKAEDEKQTLGIYVQYHPLAPYKKIIKTMNLLSIEGAYGLSDKAMSCSIIAIVSSITARKTQDGRSFSILEIADEKATMSLFLFNKELEKVSAYSAGDIVVLRCSIRKSDRGRRFNLVDIHGTEALLADMKRQNIIININAFVNIQKLLDMIQAALFEGGPHTITICLEGTVDLPLKQTFLFTNYVLMEMAKIANIQRKT